ncbi:MAG TPA: AbrB/MazE/SpoVT family DNA-binding domain-containing protein [Dokdonella sp.]
MRITSKGQVTIPREIREALGIVPSSEVEFVREGSRVWLRKRKPGAARGRSLVTRMRGRATAHMSTEEIMRLTRGEDA